MTTKKTHRSGFNLAELLVAMVVLSIVVTMMASIFRDSRSAMTQGTEQNDVETFGRVALSMITRDMQGAIADSNLTFTMREDRYTTTSYGLTNSETCFVTLQENPTGTDRAARMIMYWVQRMTNAPGRYELVRADWPGNAVSRNCYTNPSWFEDADLGGFGRPGPDAVATVVENVSGFCLTTPETRREYYSDQTNCLPRCVDIYLELLSERDAKQASGLGGTNLVEKIEWAARRFTTRVFFNNRNGYRGDKPR